MHAKLERLLSKSLITLEVMTYYLVVHTGPDAPGKPDKLAGWSRCRNPGRVEQVPNNPTTCSVILKGTFITKPENDLPFV